MIPARIRCVRESREDGFGTITWVIGMALVVVPLAVLVLVLSSWFSAVTTATGLAQDIARTMARSSDWNSGMQKVEMRAIQVAGTRRFGMGRRCGDRCLEWDVTGNVTRGATVTARVTVRMPAFVVPFLGVEPRLSWSSFHSERVDDFRSLPSRSASPP